MKREEIEKLVNFINTMIDEDGITEPQLSEIEEGEVIKELPDLTPEQLKKLFRNQVPENFDISRISAVRSPMTGDRVFLKYGDEKRWIPDLGTLERLGMNLGDVKDMTDEEMRGIKEGFGLLSSKLW